MTTVQVSKLLLSLPPPAAAPVQVVPPLLEQPHRVGSPHEPRSMGSDVGCWTGVSALDVSLRLRTEDNTTLFRSSAAHKAKAYEPAKPSAGSTAPDLIAATGSVNERPRERTSGLQHMEPQRDASRSPSPPAQRDGIRNMRYRPASAATQLRPATDASRMRLPSTASHLQLISAGQLEAKAPCMQAHVKPVSAAAPPASSRLPARLQPFRQPVAAALAAVGTVEPPSPTFSTMERAASAAAKVAARLFDTDVRPASLA